MTAVEQVPVSRGQQILLGVNDPTEGLRWYHSRVTSLEPGLIHVPRRMDEGVEVAPAVGSSLPLETWRWMDARYRIDTDVVSVDQAPMGEVVLRIRNVTRIQRRAYFRVDISIDADEAFIVDDEGCKVPIILHLFNISAGGLGARIRSADASTLIIAPGYDLECRVALIEGEEPLELHGRVVRVVGGSLYATFSDEIGVALENVTQEQRERLIQFTLQVQMECIRRGRV